MPLRDHFRPPVWKIASWEGFHGGWPMVMVQQLVKKLPEGFTAQPRVHLEANFEIDICAFKSDDSPLSAGAEQGGNGGTATATIAAPTFVVDGDLADEYIYEVQVYDETRGRTLVAAVEIVSPGNKDRSNNRRAFVAKCAALLQNRVCVSLVDLATIRRANLYSVLLELFGYADPAFRSNAPLTYAVTCRRRDGEPKSRFESWAHPLVVGAKLPTLPIWLDDERMVTLDLETAYEETCSTLRLR